MEKERKQRIKYSIAEYGRYRLLINNITMRRTFLIKNVVLHSQTEKKKI